MFQMKMEQRPNFSDYRISQVGLLLYRILDVLFEAISSEYGLSIKAFGMLAGFNIFRLLVLLLLLKKGWAFSVVYKVGLGTQ